MSWRLRIRHTTGYRYDTEVASSYNEARLIPQTDPSQLTLGSTITTSPPATQQRYWDYWGTQVTAFDVHERHAALEVTAASLVDTAPPRDPTPVAWTDLEAVRDLHTELLVPSVRTTPDPELLALAAEARARPTPYDAVQTLSQAVRDRVTYQRGSTGVQTSALEAWQLGEGVCQDIAHVTLALLRAAGVPARYVSGYLHPDPDAALDQVVVGESHAWVEAWLGDWWPFDPTNDLPVGERHVTLARGRDYGDVPPLKGVYSGGGAHSLGVKVEVTRLA